jgi:hypothetical protein
MVPAMLVLLLLPTLLLVLGILTLLAARRSARARGRWAASAVLQVAAGLGDLVAAVLAISPLWSQVTYGILILPIAAVLLALVLNIVLLGLAALLARA